MLDGSDKAPHSELKKLKEPEELRGLVRQDAGADCLPCKILGGSTLVALGGYSYLSGKHQLRQQEAAIRKSGSIFGMRSRQAGITAIALSLTGMGIWRFIN